MDRDREARPDDLPEHPIAECFGPRRVPLVSVVFLVAHYGLPLRVCAHPSRRKTTTVQDL
jgi:hypothetical protein